MDVEHNYYDYKEEQRRIKSADIDEYRHLCVRTTVDESATDYIFHLVE